MFDVFIAGSAKSGQERVSLAVPDESLLSIFQSNLFSEGWGCGLSKDPVFLRNGTFE